jgi:hypothetical protein
VVGAGAGVASRDGEEWCSALSSGEWPQCLPWRWGRAMIGRADV